MTALLFAGDNHLHLVSGQISGVLGLLGLAAAALAVHHFRRKKPTAAELETRRREWLSKFGKLGGGEVIEVSERDIAYLYDIRGMSYTASQDISAIEHRLPPDRWSVLGAVGVRYDRRNPANSIVLSETWTGLRQRDRPAK